MRRGGRSGSGQIRLLHATIAADAGRIIDRDGLANQLEGGFLQAASWTLKEEVRWDRAAIRSTDWDSYPVLRFSEVPPVTVRLIDRPDLPSVGAGEAAQGPAPAAIANAVYAAAGIRLRHTPFYPGAGDGGAQFGQRACRHGNGTRVNGLRSRVAASRIGGTALRRRGRFVSTGRRGRRVRPEWQESAPVTARLIHRPDLPSSGAGEALPGPTPAAIASAVSAAAGIRLRHTPFTAARVTAALGSGIGHAATETPYP